MYICSTGRRLIPVRERRSRNRNGYVSTVTIYECEDCSGCPHKEKCIKGNNCKKHLAERKKYSLAIVELNERINRIRKERMLLSRAIGRIETYGTDYSKMSEEEQFELGTFVNVMLSATQLLVNPIMGLQPNFSEDDYNEYLTWRDKKVESGFANKYKKQIIFFANLLFKIGLDDTDKKLIMKSFSNKKLLEALDMKKKEWDDKIFDAAIEALVCKYKYDNVRKQQHQKIVNILASATNKN